MVATRSATLDEFRRSYRDNVLIPLIEEVKMKEDPVGWAPHLAYLKKDREENPVLPF